MYEDSRVEKEKDEKMKNEEGTGFDCVYDSVMEKSMYLYAFTFTVGQRGEHRSACCYLTQPTLLNPNSP